MTLRIVSLDVLVDFAFFAASMVVNELWGHPRNYDVPVAKVHGKLVSDSDIRSLRGTQWLTDKVKILVNI